VLTRITQELTGEFLCGSLYEYRIKKTEKLTTSDGGMHSTECHFVKCCGLIMARNTLLTLPGSINQSCIFRVVQVIKSRQDPLEVENNSTGISDNVTE